MFELLSSAAETSQNAVTYSRDVYGQPYTSAGYLYGVTSSTGTNSPYASTHSLASVGHGSVVMSPVVYTQSMTESAKIGYGFPTHHSGYGHHDYGKDTHHSGMVTMTADHDECD